MTIRHGISDGSGAQAPGFEEWDHGGDEGDWGMRDVFPMGFESDVVSDDDEGSSEGSDVIVELCPVGDENTGDDDDEMTRAFATEIPDSEPTTPQRGQAQGSGGAGGQVSGGGGGQSSGAGAQGSGVNVQTIEALLQGFTDTMSVAQRVFGDQGFAQCHPWQGY